MEFCIGFSGLSKNFYLLLLAALFSILNDFIYGINYPENNKNKSLYFYNSVLKDNLILQSIMKFYGTAIISFFFNKYGNQLFGIISLNRNNYNSKSSEESDKCGTKKEKSKFLLIYNENEGPNNRRCKYIIQILFQDFCWGL